MKLLVDKSGPVQGDVIIPDKNPPIPTNHFMPVIGEVPPGARTLNMQSYLDDPSEELYNELVKPDEEVYLLNPKGGSVMLDSEGKLVEEDRKIFVAVKKNQLIKY